MTAQVEPVSTPLRRFQFRGGLVRTVVIGLLLITLIPVLIVGLLTYYRTQSVLRQQTFSQLKSVSQTYVFEMEQLAQSNNLALQKLQYSTYISSQLPDLLKSKNSLAFQTASASVTQFLLKFNENTSNQVFTQLTLIDSQGNVLASTDSGQLQTTYAGNDLLASLIDTNKTLLMLDPFSPLFVKDLVLITTLTINQNNAPVATIVGVSTSPIPSSILKTTQSLFNSANSYFATADGNFVTNERVIGSPVADKLSQSLIDILKNFIEQSGKGENFQYQNKNGRPVFAYITSIPAINSAFILEVPEQTVLGGIRAILPFIILLILAVLVVAGIAALFSARSVVVPLVDLAKNAQSFASGDWSTRAVINRKDEIGQLAQSFNQMVEQLTVYYQSLEAKVAEKTSQLIIANDIAQTSLGYSTRSEIFTHATKLISKNFKLLFAGVFLTEIDGKSASLLCGSSMTPSSRLPEQGLRIPADSTSLIGWSVLNGQSRISEDVTLENSLTNILHLVPESKSELALPILSEGALLGVLDLQSDKIGAFDSESVRLFTSLVDQIVAGLKRSVTSEGHRYTEKEEEALEQPMKEINSVKTEEEISEIILGAFAKTNYVSFFFTCDNDQIQVINFADTKGAKSDQSLIGFNFPFAKALSKLSDGQPVIIEDLKVQSDFSNLAVYFDRRGCRTVAVIPILESRKLTHLLAIGSRSPEPLTLQEVDPYLYFAESIGSNLERITLAVRYSQSTSILSLIDSIGQTALTMKGLDDLYKNLYTKLQGFLGNDVGFAVVINDDKNERISVPFYFDGEYIKIEPYSYTNDLISQTITTAGTIVHRDANAIGLAAVDNTNHKLPTRSFLGIPLTVADQTVGALALLDRNNANRFTEADQKLMTSIAPHVGPLFKIAALQTAELKALDAFAHEKFLLESLIDNLPDQITIKNAEGKLVKSSKSIMLSSENEDAELEDTSEVPDIVDKPTSDAQVMATGSPVIGIVNSTVDQAGNQSWFSTNKIPLLDENNQAIGLINVKRDITELQTTKQIADRRNNQLLTAAEIAREASSGSLQISETLHRLVDLVKEKFGFYHASIFMVDPLGQFALLKESTGEAGVKLKQAGHKLAIGSPSIVGQTTGRREPVVVNDVTKEANYYPNPLLPETRSELGIPLKVGNTLIGALDVQSTKVDAFDQEDINILQVLADQLSIAIQNANLYSKTQQTLERHRLLQQITSSAGQSATEEDTIRNAVQTLHLAMPTNQITYLTPDENGNLLIRSSSGYSIPETGTTNIKLGIGLIGLVAKTCQPILENNITEATKNKPLITGNKSALSVPILYGQRLLGVINLENETAGAFDENDLDIVTTLATNVASIISNIELVDQIKLQVERQRQLFDITSKIRRSVDIESIMQTSVAEICNALNVPRASITLRSQSPAEEKEENAI